MDIGHGIGKRIAHPGLGGQIHHALGAMDVEDLGQSGAVCDIEPHVGVVRMIEGARQPCLLEPDVIVVVEIVDPDHGVAAFE
jgi:hypothetical protein